MADKCYLDRGIQNVWIPGDEKPGDCVPTTPGYPVTPTCIPVVLTSDLEDAEAADGETVVWIAEINADATLPVSYAWYENDVLMVGETGSTLSIEVTSANRAYEYRVVVTNPCGQSMSSAATPGIVGCIQWGTGGVDQLNLVEVWRPATRYINKVGFANKIEHHGVMAVHDDEVYIIEHPVTGDWDNSVIHVSYDGGVTFNLGNPPADRQYGELWETVNGANPSWPHAISIDSIQINQFGDVYVCATPTESLYTSDPYWAKASGNITGTPSIYQWTTSGSSCQRDNIGNFHGNYEKGRAGSHAFGFDGTGRLLFTMRQGPTGPNSYRALNFGKTVVLTGSSPPVDDPHYKTPLHLHQDGGNYLNWVWTIGGDYFYSGNNGAIRRMNLSEHFNVLVHDWHKSDVTWTGAIWSNTYDGPWTYYGGTSNAPDWTLSNGDVSIERWIYTNHNILWLHKKINIAGYGIRMSYPYPPGATAYMYQIAEAEGGGAYSNTIELYTIAKTILSETRDVLHDFTVVAANDGIVCAYVYSFNQHYYDQKTPHIYIRKLHNDNPHVGAIGHNDSHWSDVVRVNFPTNMGIICNHSDENAFIKLDYSEKHNKFFVCCLVEYEDGVKGQWVGTFDDPFVCELYG